MKKILILLLFPFIGFSQELKSEHNPNGLYDYKVPVDNTSNSIKFFLNSKIIREKKGKTEYRFSLSWVRHSDHDIYYVAEDNKLGVANPEKMGSYLWFINGKDTGEKIDGMKVFVLEKGKEYYDRYYFEKWFKDKNGELILPIKIEFNKTVNAYSIEELREILEATKKYAGNAEELKKELENIKQKRQESIDVEKK